MTYVFHPATEDALSYCLYRSIARPGTTPEDVETIVRHSRRRNADRGLTGCLHYENGVFFQWLEGPWREIFRLLDLLREDTRHFEVTVIDQGVLERRLFAGWQMRQSDPEAASLFAWLSDWASRPFASDEAYAERVNAFLAAVADQE